MGNRQNITKQNGDLTQYRKFVPYGVPPPPLYANLLNTGRLEGWVSFTYAGDDNVVNRIIMEKDLFDKEFKWKTVLEKALKKYDKDTFEDRLKRLKYINKIIPKGYNLCGSVESIYIFDEAKMTFMSGEFIAAIILAQAYIERRLQEILDFRGFTKESKNGLFEIVKFLRKNEMINDFILDKIDNLRKRRNPFTHFKHMNYKFGIIMRTMNTGDQIYKILENDAKESIELMYHVSLYKII